MGRPERATCSFGMAMLLGLAGAAQPPAAPPPAEVRPATPPGPRDVPPYFVGVQQAPRVSGPGRVVRGKLRLASGSAPVRAIRGAIVRIIVEEVGRADAAARPLATLTLEDVAIDGKTPLSFLIGELHPVTSPGTRYSVRVEVDANANRKIDAGDFAVFGHPVFTGHDAEVLDIVCQPITTPPPVRLRPAGR